MERANKEKQTLNRTNPNSKKRKWAFVIVNLSMLMVVTLILFADETFLGDFHTESYVIEKHNVEGDALYTFESLNSEADDVILYNPNESMLEDTMEIVVSMDGKEREVRFHDLTIIPDDVEDLVVELSDLDEDGKAKGVLHVPSKEALYK